MNILKLAWFTQWLDKRIPPANEFQLNHRNIFIFPAKFGGLYLLLCLLLFLLGTNYQNNLMLLLCYFLVALFVVNLLSSYSNFARLTLSLGKIPEVYEGDEINLPLWFNADKSMTNSVHGIINLKFMHNSRSHWFDSDALVNPVTLSCSCHQRGWQTIERLTLSSYYPLGLFKCWTHLAFDRPILVFPKPLPCSITLQASPLAQTDDLPQNNLINSLHKQDDFSHLKAYQAGEPLRHIAWKQVAKGRGMLTKEFNSAQHSMAWLVMPPAHAEEREDRLRNLCYQVIELCRQGVIFGLDLGDICIQPASGENHRLACLSALATYPKPGQSGSQR